MASLWDDLVHKALIVPSLLVYITLPLLAWTGVSFALSSFNSILVFFTLSESLRTTRTGGLAVIPAKALKSVHVPASNIASTVSAQPKVPIIQHLDL